MTREGITTNWAEQHCVLGILCDITHWSKGAAVRIDGTLVGTLSLCPGAYPGCDLYTSDVQPEARSMQDQFEACVTAWRKRNGVGG